MNLICLFWVLTEVVLAAISGGNSYSGRNDNSSTFLDNSLSSSQEAYITDAMNVMSAMVQLSQSIKTFSQVFKTADQIMAQIETLQNYQRVLSVVGVVYSLVDTFSKSQQSQMENYLQEISFQIDILLQDMDTEFQKVLSEVQRDSCFSRYTDTVKILLSASQKLNYFYKYRGTPSAALYELHFVNGCYNDACDDATSVLLSAISGDPKLFGFDIVKILYEGVPAYQNVKGWRDQVVSKSAYLLTLVNKGLIIVSTYHCLEANNPSAWNDVQKKYQDSIKNAINHVKLYDQKCLNEYLNNSQGVLDRFVIVNQGISNYELSTNLFQKLQNFFPFVLWQVTVYNPISGSKNHVVECFNCYTKFSFHGYNIVVAALDPGYYPNYYVLNSYSLINFVRGIFFSAENLYEYIIRLQYCFYGIQVVKRYEDIRMQTNFGGRYDFVVGDSFVVMFWAVENSPCLKNKQITEGIVV